MSLLSCPECQQQVSSEAVACPNCGLPFAPPASIPAQPRVVVTEPPASEFPAWAIVPIVLVGALLVFAAFAVFSGNREDETASRVNVSATTTRPNQTTADRSETATRSTSEINVPSSSTVTTTTASPPASAPETVIPQTVTPSSSAPSRVSSVPAKGGTVLIDAKVTNQTGAVQQVKNEKFYLLDKDLESILSDADLEPIEGQTLADSFGMAVLNPSRYADFHRDALDAIAEHIKYSATTDGSGKASMREVDPDNYYLFGVTKSRTGFAVWSSPVNINDGENKVNLSPTRLTEVSE